MFQKAAVFARNVLSTIGELVGALKDLKDAITKATETTKAKDAGQHGMADSDAQAVITRKSATDAHDDKQYQHRVLTATWWTFAAIVIYAAIAALQWCEMRKTTTAAETAATAAKEAIVASRRPWVMVDVSIDAGTFDQDGLSLTIKFLFNNKGADPALYVIPDFDIVSTEGSNPVGFVKRNLEKLCGEFKDRQNRGGPNNGGFTVFPEQPRSISIGKAMSPDKVAAAGLFEWMSDPRKNPNHEPVPHVIAPIVLGCVDYEFGSPREDHQTWFAYQLPPLTVTNGPIANGLLVLSPMLFDRDAFYAD